MTGRRIRGIKTKGQWRRLVSRKRRAANRGDGPSLSMVSDKAILTFIHSRHMRDAQPPSRASDSSHDWLQLAISVIAKPEDFAKNAWKLPPDFSDGSVRDLPGTSLTLHSRKYFFLSRGAAIQVTHADIAVSRVASKKLRGTLMWSESDRKQCEGGRRK